MIFFFFTVSAVCETVEVSELSASETIGSFAASVSGVGGGAAVAETLPLPLPFLPFIGILHRHSVNTCWIEALFISGSSGVNTHFSCDNFGTYLRHSHDGRETFVGYSCECLTTFVRIYFIAFLSRSVLIVSHLCRNLFAFMS